MATLYELTDEMLRLQDLFEDLGGEITDEELDAFINLQGDIERKMEGYIAFIRECESLADARKAESVRLANKASTSANLAQRLKDRLVIAMDIMGMKKVETSLGTIGVNTTGGNQSVEIFVDPSELPDDFKIEQTTVKANKDAIREALKSGQELEFARLKDRSRYLRIS